ncbi:unnamed protein product [Ophioblennius macclurei]
MASGAKNHLCRICGGSLQGNQRRWLFGGPNRRSAMTGGSPGPMTEPYHGGSRSIQSSPWGSTMSLGSSGSLSLSRSQLSLSSSSSSCSPSKTMDLLAVLTHILGRAVQRGDGQAEFVCGRCVCMLERVFKFDTVISRVKVLSLERLQKLTQERDKIRQWIRQSYRRVEPPGSSSEDDGEAEREGYREMLRDNMALSEYECWSERWDTCPYFIRTGKRCCRGKGCEGCDSLRVSDFIYEAECGIPRHLPFQPLSPLCRDKSRSMPLHLQRVESGSGPASLCGSTVSLRTASRTASTGSLDSLDSQGPTEPSGTCSLGFLLKELRGLEGNRLSSPSGSRIPILGRDDGQSAGRSGRLSSPLVSHTLSFRENGNEQVDGEDGCVLAELRDDFVPLHQQSATSSLHHAFRQLQGRLDQALTRVRTLEDQLQGQSNGSKINGLEEPTTDGGRSRNREEESEAGGDVLQQTLTSSLHSREQLIQECLALISTLSREHGLSPALMDTLSHTLKELQFQSKEALQTVSSEMSQEQKNLQTELETLRKAGQDQDRDLDTLNTVLRHNQDVISDLREALDEKERLLEEAQQEKELWRRRDQALAAVLQEKEAQLQQHERAAGGGAGGGTSDGATLCLEVSRLTDSLQEFQQLVQVQQQSHHASLSRFSSQLQEARQALREEERSRKEAQRRQEEQQRKKEKLREALRRRDILIQEILQDAERRDFLFTELKQNKLEPVTAVKHTL